MSITSYIFWLFLIVSLLVYYVFPQKLQWVVLLVTSIFFFGLSCELYTGIYLLITIFATYVCANKMILETDQLKAKKWLIIGIVIDAGILIVLKYSNFGIENVNVLFSVFGLKKQISHISWLAPPVNKSAEWVHSHPVYVPVPVFSQPACVCACGQSSKKCRRLFCDNPHGTDFQDDAVNG